MISQNIGNLLWKASSLSYVTQPSLDRCVTFNRTVLQLI
jgi:hypothetical protein